MTGLVLLDNTVLTNFALIGRTDIVSGVWSNPCTTTAVRAEYAAGVEVRGLNPDAWDGLREVTLTATEREFAEGLKQRLGAGERSCIAVAHYRRGLFASDDYDARLVAQELGVLTTGTIGILLLAIQRDQVRLDAANILLAQLIEYGYRSPVQRLDKLL